MLTIWAVADPPLPSHKRGSSWRPARAASRSRLPGCIAYCRVLGSHTKERDLLRCTCDRPGGWTGRLHSPAARTSGRAAIETYPRGPKQGSNGAQVDTRSLRQDPGSRIKDPGSLTADPAYTPDIGTRIREQWSLLGPSCAMRCLLGVRFEESAMSVRMWGNGACIPPGQTSN